MSGPDLILYDYWRSSASYRVRIALNLLGRAYTAQPVDLLKAEHRQPAYTTLNPQGLLPSVDIDGKVMTQSLAIIEYLHATTDGSTLLPADALGQYRARQLSYAIAMEIHPVCNLSIVGHVAKLTGGGDAAKKDWMQHFIAKGLAAFEGLLAQETTQKYCAGDTPGIADCCLIPQLYNADRWGVAYDQHVQISRIAGNLRKLDAVNQAHPDVVGPPQA
ncbi:MAG: maleylacetoacetate isomerase [Cognatishimia sp.]